MLENIKDKVKEYQEYKNGEHVWEASITINNNGEIKTIKNCFVKNWLAILYVWLGNTTFTTNNNAGASKTMDGSASGGGVSEVSDEQNQANVGITVGTGSTAVDVDDTQLGTVIAHGTSATQLVYGPTNVTSIKSNSGSISYNIDSNFFNESGGTITVEEIGLLIDQELSDSSTAQFLVDRTLSTNAILDNAHLQITYQIKQT